MRMASIHALKRIMCKRFSAVWALFVCSVFGVVFAQTPNVSIPYIMSFEDTPSDVSELTHWVLRAGPQASACTDQWYVGDAVHSDGSRALYIVDTDTTTTPKFGKQPNLQFAYRDFQLPAGSYYISFDWMNMGDATKALYVGYVLATGSTADRIQADSAKGTMPLDLTRVNCSGALYGQSSWQSYTFPRKLGVSMGGATYRFYVAWSNTGSSELANSVLSACVDNIQIVDGNVKPASDIQLEEIACDTLRLSWKGNADTYSVEYRADDDDKWHSVSYDPQMGTTALIEGIPEGNYSFRVRSIMKNLDGEVVYGAYAYYQGKYLVYCPDLHCLPYFDLRGDNVKCTYGRQNQNASLESNLQTAYNVPGVIDYGQDSKLSRHTVCWDKTKRDPRTGDKLRIVPDGTAATVRLGNWDKNAEAEAITYTMTIDSAASILLLHYAVVLQDPDHEKNQQPRFTIELKDEQGKKIDETCGYINFAADSKRPGWHTIGTGSECVTWKDWTTVGLNLNPYVGKTITISVATYDCSLSAHYGYAYFWLDCTSATITTSSCSEDTHFKAKAPEGFDYRWTDMEGNIVGNKRELDVMAADSAVFTCRLINKEQPDCWFELEVLALPRFPIADGTWGYDPKDCRNRLTFTSQSYVETRYNDKEERDYNRKLLNLEWTFSNGTTSSEWICSHDFSNKGGRDSVKLTVWLADGSGECRADTMFYMTLPAIGDTTVRDTIDICKGDPYTFEDGHQFPMNKNYTYYDYTYCKERGNGCEECHECHLRVHNTYTKLDSVWVCYGDTYCLDDTVCYAADTSGLFRHTYHTRWQCDSVVVVNVNYTEPILPTIDITQMSDTVDEATFRLGGTGYTSYVVNNGDEYRTDSLFTTTTPGDYLFTFYNDHNCSDTMSVYVKSPCLREMLFQRWNDIVAIYNNEYLKSKNQDTLDIVSYQWYKDEEPIEGAMASYYCAPNGLEIGASYSCSIKLANGDSATICSLVAEDLVKATPNLVSVSPNVLPVGEGITIYTPESGQVICLDALGNCMRTLSLEAGYNTFSTNALSKGFYLLQVLQSGEKKTFRVCLQ